MFDFLKQKDIPDSHETQRGKILEVLETQGVITLPELMKIAAQYNARIFELRGRGYAIECHREYVEKDGHTQIRTHYTLEGSPEVKNNQEQLIF